MTLPAWFGSFFDLDGLQSIDGVALSFGAGWAQVSPFLVLFGSAALALLAVWFYRRIHRDTPRPARRLLAVLRATVLVLIFLALADPILALKTTSRPKPWLWVLFDGTESMALADRYTTEEIASLKALLGDVQSPPGATSNPKPPGPPPGKSSTPDSPTTSDGPGLPRQSLVRALVSTSQDNVFAKLREKYRIKAYLLDKDDAVRDLEWPEDGDFSGANLAEKLTTTGQATPLGRTLEELSLRHASGHLAGLLVISDFDQNSGPSPIESVRKLAVPVYTLGVGATAAVDLAIDLQAPLLMKKAERANLVATIRQTGLEGQTVRVRLSAERPGETTAQTTGETTSESAGESNTTTAGETIAERTVTLTSGDQPLEFPYVPTETGRFNFVARVETLPGELVTQNNVVSREVTIRDDFLRLLFVEYEPTWEWRFIKEVFHRDKLVGQRGFRTFLRSADPNVRKSNELFVSTLTPKRGDFFATDVLFLGDMPATALSQRFCEMTKEFVSKFGGGLVIIAGPRFGPSQLAQTELADMLPVVVDGGGRVRDSKSFVPRLTTEAGQFDFMNLGATDAENRKAWNTLGQLPWYQPVARLHPLATPLLVHPSDTSSDGKSPQPLIAIRKYGRGEVVFIGFNETWRLRRKYGEAYYRQFWGQMIHRLGLSHALGGQKRFVVRTDRQRYQPDEEVLVSVEAYNANFEPLSEQDLPDRKLTGELILPATADSLADNRHAISIPQFREGVFETRVPVFSPGEHRLRVTDPVTGDSVDAFFQVNSLSLERRSAVRNADLQRELASVTGGRAYELTTIRSFLDDFHPEPRTETSVRIRPVWNTWFAFTLIVTLLLAEWLLRKWFHLA
jgi:hypothetical protein